MSEKKKPYDYVESPFMLTRREFVIIGGIIIALLAVPVVWLRSALVNRNYYIKARTKGLYQDDVSSKIRMSHENPAIARFYKEFAGHPLSAVSEELLHTTYVNRMNALS